MRFVLGKREISGTAFQKFLLSRRSVVCTSLQHSAKIQGSLSDAQPTFTDAHAKTFVGWWVREYILARYKILSTVYILRAVRGIATANHGTLRVDTARIFVNPRSEFMDVVLVLVLVLASSYC